MRTRFDSATSHFSDESAFSVSEKTKMCVAVMYSSRIGVCFDMLHGNISDTCAFQEIF